MDYIITQQGTKQPSPFYKLFSAVALIAIIIGSTLYGTAFYKAHDMLATTQVSLGDDKAVATLWDKEDTESFLILGTDQSPKERDNGQPARTDVMIVAVLNKKEKQTTLLSIPRDTYVNIDYRNYDIPYGKAGILDQDKITHAHYFGSMDKTRTNPGLNAAKETVENLIGIKLDHVVSLNFEAFVDFIDAIGGIEVDVPFSFTEQNSNRKSATVSVEEGLQKLSGEQALAYVRNRHDDPRGDIGRGQRQMEVISAVIKQTVNPSLINNYDKLLSAVGDNMQSTLGVNDYMRLIEEVGALQNMVQYQLAGEGGRAANGQFYFFLNRPLLEDVRARVKQADEGQLVTPIPEEEFDTYMAEPDAIPYEAPYPYDAS